MSDFEHPRNLPAAQPGAAGPVLATKLHRPRLAAPLVDRPRLLARLTAGLEQGLLLVSAPAGYGKSTVVNQWLDTVDLPCAWINLGFSRTFRESAEYKQSGILLACLPTHSFKHRFQPS